MSSQNAQFVVTPSCCGLSQNISSEYRADDVDAILLQGVNQLSFDEFQREQEELHGVGEDIDDVNSEEMMSLLQKFEDHLSRWKKNTVFEVAEAMDKAYVTNPSLQMIFLHGNRYDPKAAAEQILKFFEMKMQLFGKDKLVQDITLADLDEDDTENLLGGSFQILPIADRSGRRIILELPGLRAFKSLRNEMRARFYMFVNLISIAKRGVVVVSYCVAQFQEKMNGVGFVEFTKLGMTMPMRIAGVHLCCDDIRDCVVAKAAMSFVSPNIKAKSKIHFGSHVECQYRLSTYGIPRAVLPLTNMKNDIVLEGHINWYKQCILEERVTNRGRKISFTALDRPSQYDVLFAGRKFSGNGNEILRSVAMDHAQTYSGGNLKERRVIVTSMVEVIRNKGGRFLKLDSDGSSWQEVPMPEVREKITQLFRNFRRPRRSQQQKTPLSLSAQSPLLESEDISANDVLFGRQAGNDGNLRLKQLVERTAAKYDAATRGQKKLLVDSLMDEIKSSKGRFLKQVEGGKWQQVSDEAAVAKISSHFRNYRRHNK